MKRICFYAVILFVPVQTVTADPGPHPPLKQGAPGIGRIIVNDDGEVRLPGNGKSWDDYLGERFRDAMDTQVDSYFLCIGATDRGPGIVHSLQSSMAYWASDKEAPHEYEEATRRSIQAAHAAGMEIFASIRMNDVHDSRFSGVKELTYPLKVERPELLLADGEGRQRGRKAYPDDSLMRWFWSGLNWDEPEVRQHFLDFVVDYCPRYEFDGLELDWFRHPLFFRFGEEEDNLNTLTQFMRKVRDALNRIGEQRGRRYLLAVRVPDTPAFARRTGLDVERWLEEDLVDVLIVGGGYMPYSARLKTFIDLAHRHDVPAYPCLNHFRGPVQMRTVASDFFALGGDGFYLFNYFGVTGEEVNPGWGASQAISLREIGSVRTLAGTEKLYRPDSGQSRAYIGYNNAPGQLPVRLVDGTPVELVVGDDLANAPKRLRLDVAVTHIGPNEGLQFRVNGTSISQQHIARLDKNRFGIRLSAPPLQRGINRLIFLPGPGSAGRLNSRVTEATLHVQYR